MNNCFKLTFDEELTDFQKLLVVKFHAYSQGFAINAVDLESFWVKFGLPRPINNVSFQQILDEMSHCERMSLQDTKSEKQYGPCTEEKGYLPSLMVNLYQQALNDTLGSLTGYLKKGNLTNEINDIAESLFQKLISLNIWISIPLMHEIMDTGGLTFELSQICKPNSNFYPQGLLLRNYIRTYQFYGLEKGLDFSCRDKTCIQEALYTSCVFIKGICGYTSLCGFLNDATYMAQNSQHVLYAITAFMLVRFHNSYLYRLEIANAPLNVNKPAESRSMIDHTTQMKFFLFDPNLVPYLVRIDMPHKGENDLHFNIRTADNKNLKEDHIPIEYNIEHVENTLEGVKEGIMSLCPNLIDWSNSTRDDDEQILSDMKLLLAFDLVSQDYLAGIKDEEHLEVLSSLFGKSFDSQADALFETYCYFNKFDKNK